MIYLSIQLITRSSNSKINLIKSSFLLLVIKDWNSAIWIV